MKKLILSALLTQLMLTAPSALANKIDPTMKKDYMKHAQALDKKQAAIFKRKADALRKYAEPIREEHKNLMEKLQPGSGKKIESEFMQALRKSRNSGEKKKALKMVQDKYAPLMKKASRHMKSDKNELSKFANKLFGKGTMIGELFELLLQIFDLREPEIIEDITFTAEYSDSEAVGAGFLLGLGSGYADEENGAVYASVLNIYDGVGWGRAGMMESFTVPPGVDRVKVSAKLDIDYDMWSVGIVSVAGGSLGSYIEVFGDNQIKCNAEIGIATTFAILLSWHWAVGEDSVTTTCEFTPDELGGEYLLSAGLKATAYGAVLGVAESDGDGIVPHMKVEFVED